jgi:hypothetical protein
VHCGVNVLSMSKQIMMEVTSISEDLGYDCYYTDTDSIHVDLEAIPHICKKYEELYGKELDGEGLGQFNNDHKIKVKLSNGKKGLCDDVYAKSCWLLGKKLYTDLNIQKLVKLWNRGISERRDFQLLLLNTIARKIK